MPTPKSIYFVLLTSCSLVSCGFFNSEESKLKKDVLKYAYDPDAVKFGDVVFDKSKTEACIEVNGKNTFGGYTGMKILAFYKEKDIGWKPHGMYEGEVCIDHLMLKNYEAK